MDAYHAAWRAVAKTEVTPQMREQAAWRAWVLEQDEDYRRMVAKRERERAERLAKDAAVADRINSTQPHNDWVGACWLDPDGNVYPVIYCGHEGKAERLVYTLFAEEVAKVRAEQGYVDSGFYLSMRGWYRIGNNGALTTNTWAEVYEASDAQRGRVAEMLASYNERGGDHWRLESFGDGLSQSLNRLDGIETNYDDDEEDDA